MSASQEWGIDKIGAPGVDSSVLGGTLLSLLIQPLFPVYLDPNSAPPQLLANADPTYPLKPWAAPAASIPTPDANGNCTFYRMPVSAAESPTGQLIAFTVPFAKAGVLNLPGVPVFDTFFVEPSGCTEVFFTGEVVTAPVAWLSTLADAQAMALELAAAYNAANPGAPISYTVREMLFLNDDPINGAPYKYAPSEARRVELLCLNGPTGTPIFAGQFIIEKNSGGVGSPGEWDFTAGPSSPEWKHLPAPQNVLAGPMVPTPVAPLPVNGKAVFISTPFGEITAIATP